MSSDVTVSNDLSTDRAAAIAALAEAARRHDGFPPLNEAALLALRHPRPAIDHLTVDDADGVLAYGQLDRSGGQPVGQLVVAPDARRQGLGRRLLTALLEAEPSLRIWATGDSAAARALAAGAGLQVARALLVLRRSLAGELPAPQATPGLTVRTFRPGEDDDAWLEVNAQAFAHHPEQGSMTADDLRARMAEDWFDPAGFFVAVDDADGRLAGFHWTKQHPARLGEVYVLAISPDAAGRGLGKALLLTGLNHLRDVGDSEVQLYVEGDNEAALGLYRAYGFTEASRDVMYAPG